jgi:hypothetical protein
LPAPPDNPKLQAQLPSSAARFAGFPDLDFFFGGGLFFDRLWHATQSTHAGESLASHHFASASSFFALQKIFQPMS